MAKNQHKDNKNAKQKETNLLPSAYAHERLTRIIKFTLYHSAWVFYKLNTTNQPWDLKQIYLIAIFIQYSF